MALSDYIVTDDLTIVLGLVAVALSLLHNLSKPQPLVHPILLGRQSDVARVRNPGESAVYRNYSTGIMGRFPLRPTKDIQSIVDFIRPDSDAPRTLWSTKITNLELLARVKAAAAGFMRLAKFTPEESNVLLLLDDGIDFVVTDLALASQSIPTFTISRLSLLSTVLENHPPSAIVTNAEFLPHILELIYDSNEHNHHTVVVVGDLDADKDYTKIAKHVNLIRFNDVEKIGANVQSELPQIDPKTIYTVSFSESPSGQLQAVQLTHQNFTAGVAATRSLVPVSNALSPLDTIVSAHSLSTPYGRTVAYTALFEGTNFATLQSTKLFHADEVVSTNALKDIESVKSYSLPSPTVLFIKPSHVQAITSAILQETPKNFFLYTLGWRHKLAGIAEGFITKDSLWDRLVFDRLRVQVLGEAAGTLRAVVVAGGGLDASALTPARVALSVPFVYAEASPLVAGPVLASHPLDLQIFSTSAKADQFSAIAPVGPPSINVEVRLAGVDDATVQAGGDPVGQLFVRGPPVGQWLGSVTEQHGEDGEGEWISTGLTAQVLSNGTFKVHN